MYHTNQIMKKKFVRISRSGTQKENKRHSGNARKKNARPPKHGKSENLLRPKNEKHRADVTVRDITTEIIYPVITEGILTITRKRPALAI